jgi:hypothetical protein
LFKPAVARVEDAEESRKSNAWEEISFFLFPHAARMHVGPASNLHGENSLFRLFNDRAESSIDTRPGKAPQTIVEARFFLKCLALLLTLKPPGSRETPLSATFLMGIDQKREEPGQIPYFVGLPNHPQRPAHAVSCVCGRTQLSPERLRGSSVSQTWHLAGAEQPETIIQPLL